MVRGLLDGDCLQYRSIPLAAERPAGQFDHITADRGAEHSLNRGVVPAPIGGQRVGSRGCSPRGRGSS